MDKCQCLECGKSDSKYRYKCCSGRFCGLQCFKEHMCPGQENVEIKRAEPLVAPKINAQLLKRLESDPTIRGMLKNPSLCASLTQVATSSDSVCALSDQLRHVNVVDFVKATLDIVEDCSDSRNGVLSDEKEPGG